VIGGSLLADEVLKTAHAFDVIERGVLLPALAVQGCAAAGTGLVGVVACHAEQQLIRVADRALVAHRRGQGTAGTEDVAAREGRRLVEQILPCTTQHKTCKIYVVFISICSSSSSNTVIQCVRIYVSYVLMHHGILAQALPWVPHLACPVKF